MPTTTTKPGAKYREEFRKAGGQQSLGVTESEYIATGMRDEAGGVVDEFFDRTTEGDRQPAVGPAADKYRKEFQAAGGKWSLGVTEEEYVRSCLRTDAGGSLGD